MTFIPVWFTGFEDGNADRFSGGNFTVQSTTKKTGSYGGYLNYPSLLQASTTQVTLASGLSAAGAEFYFSMWVIPNTNYADSNYTRFAFADGNYIDLKYNSTHWDVYVGASLVGTGTVNTTVGSWQHVQLHVKIDNSGNIDTKIDGVADIAYSGDTQPSSATTLSTITSYITFTQYTQKNCYFDDVAVGTNGWPGDLRVDVLLPNGDSSVQWTHSIGSTNYGTIDEVPASDTDYNSITTTGQKDIIDLTDFTATNKTPLAAMLITRMNRDTANSDTIKMGLRSNGTEVVDTKTISTTLTYYTKLFTTDPNGSIAWTDAGLDALQLIYESVIA